MRNWIIIHFYFCRGIASFFTSCRPGWLSFPHILKIARMTSLHWPHQHFELLSFLAHPNNQHAKKVMSDSRGLVDFAFGLVVFVVNLSDGQVLCFGENSNYRRIVINPANQQGFWASWNDLWASTHASYSLPKWQAVKLTFFAPWPHIIYYKR